MFLGVLRFRLAFDVPDPTFILTDIAMLEGALTAETIKSVYKIVLMHIDETIHEADEGAEDYYKHKKDWDTVITALKIFVRYYDSQKVKQEV